MSQNEIEQKFKQFCDDRTFSPETVRTYEVMFNLWQKYMGYPVDKLVKIAYEDKERAREQIQTYIRERKGNTSVSHLRSMRNAIKVLFNAVGIGDKQFPWESVAIPKGNGKSKRRAYIKEEIMRLLQGADERLSALIFYFCGVGAREGSIDFLKLKHIFVYDENKKAHEYLSWFNASERFKPIACKVVIYADELQEDFKFGTHEVPEKLALYIEERIRNGESISPDSYVFVSHFGGKISPIKSETAGMILWRLLHNKKMHDGKIMPTHSFRKYYETTMALNGGSELNALIIERLNNHSIKLGTAAPYVLPNEEQLLEMFLKIEPDLCIFEKKDTVSNEELDKKLMLSQLEGMIMSLRFFTTENIQAPEELYGSEELSIDEKIERLRNYIKEKQGNWLRNPIVMQKHGEAISKKSTVILSKTTKDYMKELGRFYEQGYVKIEELNGEVLLAKCV